MDDLALLSELEPLAEKLLNRHIDSAKEWFPHDLVPWSRAADFPEVGTPSGEVDILEPAVRSALFVNLLTEDNLPYYFRDIERMFGADGVFGEWTRRWTAEEGRHAIAIRDYITVCRLIDPVELERGRMLQVSGGMVPEPPTAARGMVYVALQELATRISHRNTGKLMEDKVGYDIMAKVASDENRHYLFYRDLTEAALVMDPSAMIIAIEAEVREFAMPGVGIPEFSAHASAISRAGIYSLGVHYREILEPVILKRWNVGSIEGLSPEAEQAQVALLDRLRRLERVAEREASRRGELEPA